MNQGNNGQWVFEFLWSAEVERNDVEVVEDLVRLMVLQMEQVSAEFLTRMVPWSNHQMSLVLYPHFNHSV